MLINFIFSFILIFQVEINHISPENSINIDSKKDSIFSAIRSKDMEKIDIYIKNLKSLDIYNSQGYTPLIMAIFNKDIDIIEKLLKAKANPNLERSTKKLYRSNKEEMGRVPISYAASLGDLDIIKKLIKYGANPSIPNKLSETALHFATKNGYFDIVKYLFPLTKKKYLNSKLIYYAIRSKNIDILKFFKSKNLSLNYKDHSHTSLTLAILTKSFEIFKYIADGTNLIKKESKGGFYPLILAIKKGNKDIVEYLLKKGSDPNYKNSRGEQPLFVAVKKGGDPEIVKLLIKYGADPNSVDHIKRTPIMIVANRGHIETFKILFTITDLTKKDYMGKSLIHYAAKNFQIFSIILKKYKDIDRFKNKDGESLFLTLLKRGHFKSVYLYPIDKVDKNEKDIDGYPPLMITVTKGDLTLTKYLLDNGFNPNIKSDSGISPLTQAIKQQNIDLIRILIFYKADIEIKFGEADIFRYLIENRADRILSIFIDLKDKIIN